MGTASGVVHGNRQREVQDLGAVWKSAMSDLDVVDRRRERWQRDQQRTQVLNGGVEELGEAACTKMELRGELR